jgi:integrase
MARRRYQKGCLFKKGKNWVLRYREDVFNPDGSAARVHRSVVLGCLRTKLEAEKLADTYTRKINDYTRRPQAALTLAEFWEKYFDPEILPTLKYTTCRLYRILMAKHLLPALGQQKLCDVGPIHIQQLIGQKQRQGYSPQTLAHFRNLLSKIFGTAKRWEWVQMNPARGIELPAMERRRKARLLTPDEIAKLARTLREPARMIFLMGTLTGLRIGELLGLQIQDVDLAQARVSIRRDVYCGRVGSPKTPGSERHVPLAAPLIPVLKAWLRKRKGKSEWLFPSAAGTPLRDRNLLRRQVWPACTRLGIERFGWHSLRHTFSTYNGNAGVALPVLQSLLGHASPETTMIYTHPLEDVKRQAIENLASLLFPNVPQKEKVFVKGSTLIQ